MRYFVFSIFFFLISILNLLTQINEKYSGLTVGDTVTVIDKKINYKARLYIFTDLSSCNIVNININRLYKMYGNTNEFIVFVAGSDHNDLDLLSDIFDKDIHLIGDKYGIYKEYYGVKYQPLILLLNKYGVVYAWDNVKNLMLNIDSTINVITNSYKNEKEYNLTKVLKEIKRIKIRMNEKPVITSLFHDALYNKKEKEFIISNMRSPTILKVDSSGNIIKVFNNNQLEMVMSLGWSEQDSIVFLYGFGRDGRAFQLLNVVDDSLFNANFFHPEFREGYNAVPMLGKNMYINNFDYYHKQNKLLLPNDTNCSIIRDMNGKLIAVFDTIDNIFSKYKLSSTFDVSSAYSKGRIYTLQEYTNKLKIWDLNLNLLRTINLDLGENYKKIKSDLPDFGTPEKAAKFFNLVSLFQKLYVDEKTNNILLCFKNETYPPGVYDYMSDKVKYEMIINIYNSEGEKLNKQEIILPKATLPFHFEDNYIYTTETNGNKLEIVKYKFIKTE